MKFLVLNWKSSLMLCFGFFLLFYAATLLRRWRQNGSQHSHISCSTPYGWLCWSHTVSSTHMQFQFHICLWSFYRCGESFGRIWNPVILIYCNLPSSPQVAGLSTRFRFGPPEDVLTQASSLHSDLGQLASQGGTTYTCMRTQIPVLQPLPWHWRCIQPLTITLQPVGNLLPQLKPNSDFDLRTQSLISNSPVQL